MLEECAYIDSFLHESQTNQDQEYTCIEHIKFSLELLEKGLESCQALLGGNETTEGAETHKEGDNSCENDDRQEEVSKEMEQHMGEAGESMI